MAAVDGVHRAAPSVVAGGVLAILLVRLAWSAGGYFPPSYLGAGTIALLVSGVLIAAARPTYLFSSQALFALAGLAGLTLWTGLSSLWSPAPSGAMDAMQRDLAYVGLLVLGMLAAGSGRYARHVVWLAFGVMTVVCVGGLLSRILPGWIGVASGTGGTYRLSYPLTYWNAFGALSAMGAVVGLGLAGDPRTRWELRTAAAVASVLMVIAMALSQSRGAWLALFAGIVVLAVMTRHRGSMLLTAGIVALGWLAALARLRGYPALTDDPTAGSGQVSAGHAYAAQLLVICAAVGAGMAFLGAARSSQQVMDQARRVFRPIFVLAAVLALVVAGGIYLTHTTRVEGATTSGADRASHWISRQWDDFLQAAPTPTAGASRVTAGGGGTRSEVYRLALRTFGDHPFAGAGGGSFKVYWFAKRPIGERTTNAHSLELETLSELGILGAALLLLFLGSVVWAAVRARVRPGGLARGQVAAVTAGCTVWMVHSALDWDWQMPALTGVFLLLACTLFPYGRRARSVE